MPVKAMKAKQRRRYRALSPTYLGLARDGLSSAQVGNIRLALGESWRGGYWREPINAGANTPLSVTPAARLGLPDKGGGMAWSTR